MTFELSLRHVFMLYTLLFCVCMYTSCLFLEDCSVGLRLLFRHLMIIASVMLFIAVYFHFTIPSMAYLVVDGLYVVSCNEFSIQWNPFNTISWGPSKLV